MTAGTDPSLVSASLRMLWGLLIVSGVILVIYGVMRKKFSFAGTNSKSRIQIKEVRHIMPKKSLCLVEIDGQEFLLGLSADNITLLSPLETKKQPSFQDNLETAKQNEL
jgi:flagellar protein FliO/FliZ